MEDAKLSAEEIEEILAQLEREKYNRQMLDLVREDLEYGLSRKQIEMYKSKKLRYEQRREISNAMRHGVPDDVVSRFSGGRYTEQQISIFVDEYAEGFDAVRLLEIMDSTQSGYDMKEACAKVKTKLSMTREREPERVAHEAAQKPEEEGKTVTEVQEAVQPVIGTNEFLASMKMMVDAFSNTMLMQFERMDRRDEEFRQAYNREAEALMNDRISALESQLADSKKDLSAASGVVSEKEQQLKSMQSDMDIRTKELSEKDAEIKKLREEMEQMKAGNISINKSAAKADAGHTADYTVNLTTAGGGQIPIQVERTERKSPFGLSAFMSKFLPKGPAKTLLARMIDGRYSGAQLSEIVYAYDSRLDEAEVQELLDANLPADEMHGIIDVVAAAKKSSE